MAHTMHFHTFSASPVKDKKSYSLSFKGVLMHLVDTLLVEHHDTSRVYTQELSSHIKKDVGLIR